ncbi:MAG TPA: hypothetical protein VM733_14830 [Thermoanaerobaculia bacterium]|nr:hypothetical protein [Thermoanaerobaculia bacterium]
MKRIAVLVLVLGAAALPSFAQCNTPPFPVPVVSYTGMTVEPNFNRYHFAVKNYAQFSDLLFVKSPTLPPCGLNTEASRTWVDIFRANGTRIYGYCAIHDNAQLLRLSFAIKKTDPQPKAFFITMTDRKCKRVVKSAVVPIP